MFDLIIIGAGPIGLATGIAAKKAGLKYKIIEKGCLVNSLFHYPQHMTFFSTSEKLEIGGVPFVSHNPRPTRAEALEYYRRVQTLWELDIHLFEQVLGSEKQDNNFHIRTSKSVYISRNIVVATGFFDIPNLMHIPGEDLPKVKHYYDDPHLYAFSKVAVIGAANSAIDAALQTYRKGAEVTLIIKENEISDRVKYWVKPDIENRIKEGSVKAFFNAELMEVKEKEVVLRDENGSIRHLENDFVLAMTGYQPDFKFLKKLGVQVEEGFPIYNPSTNETNVAGLFLAGVVCGGMKTNTWFIENSIIHGELVVNQIVERNSISI
ncbi:YpdA family putative bacillithiol disulfide reductase [Persicobacter diffluens]|uniref:Pyridine nucleotide-disulfide oxidoreductase n=1 Tax=Persicobacter diffluens TaxID=981 RepID=A0AAN5APK3_9BACT|nr:pyridine nucleotide-disulfide oxidoreductase [Persicobacter diffluens]